MPKCADWPIVWVGLAQTKPKPNEGFKEYKVS